MIYALLLPSAQSFFLAKSAKHAKRFVVGELWRIQAGEKFGILFPRLLYCLGDAPGGNNTDVGGRIGRLGIGTRRMIKQYVGGKHGLGAGEKIPEIFSGMSR